MIVRDVCVLLHQETGMSEVALSGSLFQNITLLDLVVPLLREAGPSTWSRPTTAASRWAGGDRRRAKQSLTTGRFCITL